MTNSEIADLSLKYGAVQKKEELVWLLDILSNSSPRKLAVELGVYYGATFYAFSQFFDQVVWIDLKKIPFAFEQRSSDKMLLGDTCDPALVQSVTDPIDFLFIDANHHYEYVARDFKTWKSKIRPGGLIAFHDIHGAPNGDGAKQLWEDLVRSAVYPTRQMIVADKYYGIGVLSL